MTGTVCDPLIMEIPMMLCYQVLSFGKYKICLWFVVTWVQRGEVTISETTTTLHMRWFG